MTERQPTKKLTDGRLVGYAAVVALSLTAGLVVLGGSAGLALRAFHIAAGG